MAKLSRGNRLRGRSVVAWASPTIPPPFVKVAAKTFCFRSPFRGESEIRWM